jgi:hypothetical protein
MSQRCNGKRHDSLELQSDDPAALKLRLKEAEKQIRRLFVLRFCAKSRSSTTPRGNHE